MTCYWKLRNTLIRRGTEFDRPRKPEPNGGAAHPALQGTGQGPKRTRIFLCRTVFPPATGLKQRQTTHKESTYLDSRHGRGSGKRDTTETTTSAAARSPDNSRLLHVAGGEPPYIGPALRLLSPVMSRFSTPATVTF